MKPAEVYQIFPSWKCKPREWSSSDFHAFIFWFQPVLRFIPRFIPGKIVSDGESKLSHKYPSEWLRENSLKTRLPATKSCKAGLPVALGRITFHIMPKSLSCERLSEDNYNFPDLELIEPFLLATQIIRGGRFLYEMTKKLWLEFPGLKNPNSKDSVGRHQAIATPERTRCKQNVSYLCFIGAWW